MKTKKMFYRLPLILFFFLGVSCSPEDNQVEEEVMVTKCVTIIEKDTDLPVTNTSIHFQGNFSCLSLGCGYGLMGTAKTDENGEVCITLNQEDFEDVVHISCSWNDRYLVASFDSLSSVDVIYVDTLYEY